MRSSDGEVKIFNVLTDCGLPFEEEYEFADLVSSHGRRLRFDFAVFDPAGNIAFLVEFQGKQHYVPVKAFGGEKGFHRQRSNDRKKREYCIRHGYRLVCIPYWDVDKISYEYMMRAAGYEM